MTTYTKKDTINELSADQLDLMAKSDPSFVVGFLADNSAYDAHRVRLLMELGAIEAGRRLQALRAVTREAEALGDKGDSHAERAAFITAYRLWTYEAHPKAHPEMVQFQAESHWGRAAGAMWLAARRRTSPSIGEDGLPEPAAFGVYSNIGGNMRALTKLTTDEVEADRYSDREDMARIGCDRRKVKLFTEQQVREAVAVDRRAREEAGNALNDLLPREVTVTNYGNPVDKSPQAAQGVKTWQERESVYETEPMRQIDQMTAEIAELRTRLSKLVSQVHYWMDRGDRALTANERMEHEIAELRAQLARQSQGAPLAWRFKRRSDRFWQTTADREVAASIGGANVEIVPLYAAPPLSSEQQAEKGEK